MRAYLYNFVVFALDLPGLKAEDLEDVIKQAATLNVARQLNKYEVRVLWISRMDRIQILWSAGYPVSGPRGRGG